jgi:hypothetical protein
MPDPSQELRHVLVEGIVTEKELVEASTFVCGIVEQAWAVLFLGKC